MPSFFMYIHICNQIYCADCKQPLTWPQPRQQLALRFNLLHTQIFHFCPGDFLAMPTATLLLAIWSGLVWSGPAAFNKICIVLWLHSYCCCRICCHGSWPPLCCLPFTSSNWIKLARFRWAHSRSQLAAAKFFPPENAASVFYKLSIVRKEIAWQTRKTKWTAILTA